MELLGIPQGMGVFHVNAASVQFTTEDGWQGSRQFPTFWVVGATETDALSNAATVLQFREGDVMPDGATVTRVYVSVMRADVETEPIS